MPKGPAVAGVEPLGQRADTMDRADGSPERKRTVSADDCRMPPFGVDQCNTGRYQPALEQGRKRDARGLTRSHERCERRFGQGRGFGDALLGGGGIFGLPLNPYESPLELASNRSGRTGSTKRIEYKIVGLRRGKDRARQQRFRLLRGMQLFAVWPLEPFFAGA